MHIDEALGGARLETIEELSSLLAVVQEMGHRLASETHGDAYDLVRELNERLHEARAAMLRIQGVLAAARRG